MHASKFTKFKFIVRDARVFPGIWFDFIYPHILSLFLACIASVSARVRRESWDVASLFFHLLLRYLLQPIRIRFTALYCFETNIYQRVFLRGRTHANKAVTDRQTKFVNKHLITVLSVRLI